MQKGGVVSAVGPPELVPAKEIPCSTSCELSAERSRAVGVDPRAGVGAVAQPFAGGASGKGSGVPQVRPGGPGRNGVGVALGSVNGISTRLVLHSDPAPRPQDTNRPSLAPAPSSAGGGDLSENSRHSSPAVTSAGAAALLPSPQVAGPGQRGMGTIHRQTKMEMAERELEEETEADQANVGVGITAAPPPPIEVSAAPLGLASENETAEKKEEEKDAGSRREGSAGGGTAGKSHLPPRLKGLHGSVNPPPGTSTSTPPISNHPQHLHTSSSNNRSSSGSSPTISGMTKSAPGGGPAVAMGPSPLSTSGRRSLETKTVPVPPTEEGSGTGGGSKRIGRYHTQSASPPLTTTTTTAAATHRTHAPSDPHDPTRVDATAPNPPRSVPDAAEQRSDDAPRSSPRVAREFATTTSAQGSNRASGGGREPVIQQHPHPHSHLPLRQSQHGRQQAEASAAKALPVDVPQSEAASSNTKGMHPPAAGAALASSALVAPPPTASQHPAVGLDTIENVHSPLRTLTCNVKTLYTLLREDMVRRLRQTSGVKYNQGYDDQDGHYRGIIGETILQRYIVTGTLGSGSFGKVLRCYDEKRARNVALKITRTGKTFREQAKLEVNIVLALNRLPRVNQLAVRLLKAFEWMGHMVLSFEMLGHNLFQVLKMTGFKGLSLDFIRDISYQLLKVLREMGNHQPNGIIHSDIKPENVLVRSSSSRQVTLIDFGSACYMGHCLHKYIQSRFYRSPEVILNLPYDTAIDRWSLGCMMMELLTGVPLFGGRDEKEQLALFEATLGPVPGDMLQKSIKARKFYVYKDEKYQLIDPLNVKRRTLSSIVMERQGARGAARGGADHAGDRAEEEPGYYDQFIHLVSRLLAYRPTDRIGCADAMQHPFFSESADHDAPRLHPK